MVSLQQSMVATGATSGRWRRWSICNLQQAYTDLLQQRIFDPLAWQRHHLIEAGPG